MKYLLVFLISINCYAVTYTATNGQTIEVTQASCDEMTILNQVKTYDCTNQAAGYDRVLCDIVKRLVYHSEGLVIKGE